MKNIPPDDWDEFDALDDDEMDLIDIPSLQPSFFENDTARQPQPKYTISLQIERDVLVWFRAQGPGWEKHMASALRQYMEARKSNNRDMQKPNQAP